MNAQDQDLSDLSTRWDFFWTTCKGNDAFAIVFAPAGSSLAEAVAIGYANGVSRGNPLREVQGPDGFWTAEKGPRGGLPGINPEKPATFSFHPW